MSESHPDTIGGYEVVRVLGHGSMGSVFLAHDAVLDRPLAIKLLRPDFLEQHPSASRRFTAEARAIAALNHPNIVTVYELGIDGGCPFIAMEYVEGETLSRIIRKRRPMTVIQKLLVCCDLCSALEHAHDRGVVHRDIKPANITLTDSGLVKLLDFGIAKRPNNGVVSTSQIGTPAYLAPERVRGEEADARSDLFSVGVILYEWLAFERPFAARDMSGMVWQILNEPVVRLDRKCEDVPTRLADVVERSLAKEPALRFQRAADLRAELVICLEDARTPTEDPHTAPEETGKPASGHPAGTGETTSASSPQLQVAAAPASSWRRLTAWLPALGRADGNDKSK